MKYKIKANKIWDGVSNGYIKDTEIYVEDDKIVSELSGSEEIDLSDYTLMPGLINAHVHLCLNCELDTVHAVTHDSRNTIAIKAADNARKTIMAGITTVRDMGSFHDVVPELTKLVDSGYILGPRIVHSGYLICTTGGHGWFFGREADGVDDCRKAAREQLKVGAQWIKLMATGGILTPGVSSECYQLNEDEMRVCCEEAHKAEKRAATHAQGASGVNNALRAGVDTVEHGFFIDNESIELFLKKGAWLVPTLNAPTATIDADVPKFAKEKARRALDGFSGRLEKAIKAGVKIGAGSDSGTPMNWHDGYYMEIVLMSETSLGIVNSLKCTTSRNAELLGMGDRLGQIADGFTSDIIAVKGDPLSNPHDLKNVVFVMKDGQIIRNDA